jgi:hypothetical protein
MVEFRLAGKTAIVTGGSAGIRKVIWIVMPDINGFLG